MEENNKGNEVSEKNKDRQRINVKRKMENRNEKEDKNFCGMKAVK